VAGVKDIKMPKIERGEANPSLKVLISLLDTLGLEMELTIKNKI
jgi:DNA-binding XRE family transcriptional regulator